MTTQHELWIDGLRSERLVELPDGIFDKDIRLLQTLAELGLFPIYDNDLGGMYLSRDSKGKYPVVRVRGRRHAYELSFPLGGKVEKQRTWKVYHYLYTARPGGHTTPYLAQPRKLMGKIKLRGGATDGEIIDAMAPYLFTPKARVQREAEHIVVEPIVENAEPPYRTFVLIPAARR